MYPSPHLPIHQFIHMCTSFCMIKLVLEQLKQSSQIDKKGLVDANKETEQLGLHGEFLVVSLLLSPGHPGAVLIHFELLDNYDHINGRR